MKRTLFSILILIMATAAIFTLCACGKNGGNGGGASEEEAACQHEWKFLNGTQPACAPNGFSIYKCDSCGETVKGKQYVEEIFGVEVEICKDCKKNLDEAKEDVNDLKDAIGGLFDDEK